MINGTRKENLVVDLVARGHHLLSGLDEKLGGRDEGFNPHEIFEASLAACTILTAQMYANRKGIKLESTDVTVKILKEGAESVVAREVSFHGDLSNEDREKLAEMIGKCPIHKLMESQIKVETTIS